MPSNTPVKLSEGNKEDNEEKLKDVATPQKALVKFIDQRSESDEAISSGDEPSHLTREVNKEIRKRRKTIVNSFRLAELVPTTNTPHSNYRRKSIVILTTQTVIDAKAEQQ
ncbi:hypothetical protein OS493_024747 [Desmophyllum pertusum]|uniref:Uncharacterized protein n=1 Tax=Desmophyllum pertusum TaxID=174260 RepID=A0A9W9ZDC4_9CNID|nr:hypothetical protein OS493_024747 [Desmophyllum pertusum]